MIKPRILYLDVDDTLLVWTNSQQGFAAPMAAEFIHWANEHFEVRWLTAWCPSGKLRQHGAEELSYRFHGTIPAEMFMTFNNPKQWIDQKTEGIDWSDERPWVWVEDALLPKERMFLTPKWIDQFYPTHVTHNVVALQSTWRKLAKTFDLPNGPAIPYTTEMVPSPMTDDIHAMIDRLRNDRLHNNVKNR